MMEIQMESWMLLPLFAIIGVVLYLIRWYLQGGICHHAPKLTGRTAIVTGANCGIGYETAFRLAELDARVIIACRDVNKGIDAASKIRSASGNNKVIVHSLDLADLDSVKAFANNILQSENDISYLINNAGVMACPPMTTKQGFEYQLGVNHLGHFLLTSLLLERIKECRSSRIVNVSSKAGLHFYAKMHFDDLMFEKGEYNPWKAYAQSKLANILFTRQLAKILEGTSVTTNCCHPGVVNTNLFRHLHVVPRVLFESIVSSFIKTPHAGAQTQLYLALAPELSSVSGHFFADCKRENVSKKLSNDEDAERLWSISRELVSNYL